MGTAVESKHGVDIELFERDLKVDGVVLLGRQRTHDPRSRQFDGITSLPPYAVVDGEAKLLNVPVLWRRVAPIWDQGEVGCCTACAALGLLVSDPFYRTGFDLSQRNVVPVYMEETRIDDNEIPGHYEPDDTGSSGLYSMKVLQRRGWIHSYYHAFSTKTALAMLQNNGPISIGVPWYDSMMKPNKANEVVISPKAEVVGGHQFVCQGVDYRKRLVRCAQSWGLEWGDKGYFDLSFKTFDRLLSEGGDAVQPRMHV